MLVLCSAHRLQGDHQAYRVTLDGKHYVANFARHPYPLKVHKCWATRGLMPELRTCPNGNEVTYVPGGWSLVYMDYLSPSDGWKTLHEWKGLQKVGVDQLAGADKDLVPEALHPALKAVDTPHHLMPSQVSRACRKRLHASVRCTSLSSSCINCRST